MYTKMSSQNYKNSQRKHRTKVVTLDLKRGTTTYKKIETLKFIKIKNFSLKDTVIK